MMFTDGGFIPLPLLLSLPKDFIGEGDHKIPCSTWYLDNVAHHKQEKQSSIKCSRLHFPLKQNPNKQWQIILFKGFVQERKCVSTNSKEGVTQAPTQSRSRACAL